MVWKLIKEQNGIKIIQILFWSVIFFQTTVSADMFAPDTSGWIICGEDSDCEVIEGACDWTVVNQKHITQAQPYYLQLQKLVECANPGNIGPKPIPECRLNQCVIEEKPMARVFDSIIFPSAVNPPQEVFNRNRSQMSESEFIQWNKEFQKQTLEFLIFSKAQKHLLDEAGMNPTEAEIQSFIVFSAKEEETRLGELESQRQVLSEQLQADGLTEKKKIMLTEYLSVTDQLIEQERIRKEEENSRPDSSKIKQETLSNVARVVVAAWKFNKVLYEKYGGRVIFQQAGWEPIDAYKQWLEEHLQAKTIEIFDPEFMNIFDQMFRYFEGKHTFMPNDKADQYFSKPWWDPAFEAL